MKRSLLTVAVIVSLFSLVASASAGQKNRNRDRDNNNNGQSSFQNLNLSRHLGGQSGGIATIVSNFTKKDHKHHNKPKPKPQLDPNRPDDRVPVEPVAPVTPPGRPGYVWVGDHWEREQAPKPPQMIVNPLSGTVGPAVRNHRTTTAPIVRDHRTTTAPVVRDHRIGSPSGEVTSGAPGSRDHRTPKPQPVVRDHR